MSTRRLARVAVATALSSLLVCVACARGRSAGPAPEQSSSVSAAVTPQAPTVPVVAPAVHASTAIGHGNERQRCEQICRAAISLHCRRAQACESNCVAMASTGVCDRALGAFFDCLKAQPTERWECLEDGTAAIRDGYCDNEQAGVAACLQEK